MNDEENLNKAMDEFLDAMEYDNKLVIKRIKQFGLCLAGLIIILLVAIYAQ